MARREKTVPTPQIGTRFGRLTVQEITDRRVVGGRGVYVICLCDCGRTIEASSWGLAFGTKTRHYQHCGQCGPKGTSYKPICSHGHDTTKWGRTPSGACRGCTKESSIKNNYGLSLEDFVQLWNAQDGKCAICGKSLGGLFEYAMPGFFRGGRAEVDHEHRKDIPKRMTVRGLLCGGRRAGCNRKIGRVDNPEWLEKVLVYLRNPPARIILVDKSEKPA